MDKKINNNGYDYVDLGLPSGTLWASCNVGADKPSDSGLYFQWGDTKGYTKEQIGKDKQFNWKNYKWNPSGDGYTFTKYANPGDTLELEDDAAHVNMGGDWHIPTPKQCQELIDNTISEWTKQDNVKGMIFTSKQDNSKSIFIPAVGNAFCDLIDDNEIFGYIWSSMLDAYYDDYGNALYFVSRGAHIDGYDRDFGISVRGVIG